MGDDITMGCVWEVVMDKREYFSPRQLQALANNIAAARVCLNYGDIARAMGFLDRVCDQIPVSLYPNHDVILTELKASGGLHNGR